MSSDTPESSFAELNLPSFLLKALQQVGYESPSPIQEATIPLLLANKDVVGMAQTGTGKTAAFALPILANLDIKQKNPQALVLCPTRELAIQVAEAFQTYASFIKGFHVLPVYGGQDMGGQLRGLRRGAHVIVGTPGRLLDHLNRKSLDLSEIKTLVLDEADEMLRMGFIDDVETILQRTPDNRRVALFSATMPPVIRKVANKYLNKPEEIRIETSVTTNENIEQHYWLVTGTNKLDALTRILEVETFDGMIIFVRTKTATVELADKLSARGFSASALNGDMNQNLRQRAVENLKRGKLDILIATDVAARGLDVERISHVLNYDIPYDEESYVHRIGRTGRAGRKGKAILFVAPRERRLLGSIERTTRQTIKQMTLPSQEELIGIRSRIFKEQVIASVGNPDTAFFQKIVSEMCEENNLTSEDVAASLAYLLQKNRPLIPPPIKASNESNYNGKGRDGKRDRNDRSRRDRGEGRDRGGRDGRRDRGPAPAPEAGMTRYKLQVGHEDQVKPGEIVGAIANEAGIDGNNIGKIKIYDDYSTVDLPEGMPKDMFQLLQKVRVKNKPMRLSAFDSKATPSGGSDKPRGGFKKPFNKKKSNDSGDKGRFKKDFKRKKEKPKSD
ncbi:DEAD/DEAH box helicase [Aurantivibrio infirmus]